MSFCRGIRRRGARGASLWRTRRSVNAPSLRLFLPVAHWGKNAHNDGRRTVAGAFGLSGWKTLSRLPFPAQGRYRLAAMCPGGSLWCLLPRSMISRRQFHDSPFHPPAFSRRDRPPAAGRPAFHRAPGLQVPPVPQTSGSLRRHARRHHLAGRSAPSAHRGRGRPARRLSPAPALRARRGSGAHPCLQRHYGQAQDPGLHGQ